MINKEIAKHLDLIATLMELHDENIFKIRSYQNAYNAIRQNSEDLSKMNFEQLNQIKGIGKSIASDIVELNQTGIINTLDILLKNTPEGIIDLLKIKGIGPKKIRSLWQDLNITSLGELEYAINENRLTLLKGFGLKIQENVLSQIEFLNASKGKLLYNKAKFLADELISKLTVNFPQNNFETTGELRRQLPILDKLELITDVDILKINEFQDPDFLKNEDNFYYKNVIVNLTFTDFQNFIKDQFVTTGPKEFVQNLNLENSKTEEEIFSSNSLPFIPSNFRDTFKEIEKFKSFDVAKYISKKDIKGILHNHTIWSDGADKLIEMASFYQELGYEYMLVSDHSKSAFYANGVKENDVIKYIEEIRETNKLLEGFTIFAGIESDILSDGSLDYEEELLKMFDVIIASVHSGLNMGQEKATLRLLKAIENPHTRILGHMTGRILLAREGYPLNIDKVTDACIANDVVIELNANPQRLDMDWKLISKAQDKGIKFAINPDAHSKYEVKYIDYGVSIAQKGGMQTQNCINALDLSGFINWIESK